MFLIVSTSDLTFYIITVVVIAVIAGILIARAKRKPPESLYIKKLDSDTFNRLISSLSEVFIGYRYLPVSQQENLYTFERKEPGVKKLATVRFDEQSECFQVVVTAPGQIKLSVKKALAPYLFEGQEKIQTR